MLRFFDYNNLTFKLFYRLLCRMGMSNGKNTDLLKFENTNFILN